MEMMVSTEKRFIELVVFGNVDGSGNDAEVVPHVKATDGFTFQRNDVVYVVFDASELFHAAAQIATFNHHQLS